MAERPLFDTKKKETGEKLEKNVVPVVSGVAKTKKKSEVKKLTDIFIAEDISNVKSYVVMDVLIPAVKKAISEIVSNGVDMILYGESGRNKKHGTASKVSYGGFYKNERDRRDHRDTRLRSGLDYDDIIFDARGDADAVLTAMDEIIDKYTFVTVADLYDLAEVSTNNYALNKYGWTDIRTAQVVRVRDGYMIKLPRALPLD